MKKILSIFLLTITVLSAMSQVPNQFNYQGVARNSVGNALINQPIALRLSIHDGSAGGTVVYRETRAVVTNYFGLFNVAMGSAGATNVTGTIGGINWGSGGKFLQVEIDPSGGSSFLDMGTTQLSSVPYSLFSGLASPTGIAGGSLTGTYPNPTIANGAVIQTMIASGVTLPPSGAAGGSLTGTYPNPTIANGAVTQAMIAAGVTLPPSGTAGGDLQGTYPNPTLKLPFSKTQSDGGALISITNSGAGDAFNGINTGTGRGAFFQINNAANAAAALSATTNGTGNAALFQNTNAANAAAVLSATTNGTGNAALFQNTNAANLADALNVSTNGGATSWAIRATSTGTQGAGIFNYNNSSGAANALRVLTNGSGFAANITSSNATPLALRTAGGLQLTGIGEGVNKLLVSDASGNAAWQTLTSAGGVIGTGTLNFLPKWTPNGTALGNSQIVDDGTNVGIGITLPLAKLHVTTTDATGFRSNVNFSTPVDFSMHRQSNIFESNNTNFGVISYSNCSSLLVPDWVGSVVGVDSSNQFFNSGIAGFYKGNDLGNGIYGFASQNGDLSLTPTQGTGFSGGTFFGGDIGVFAVGGSFVTQGPSPIKYGIYAVAGAGTTNYAGYFEGDVQVNGNFTATGVKAFRIDHPLDPANKYLNHYAMESPEVQNVYNGNTVTDENGKAVIKLPNYFDAINKDFKYQLTIVDETQFAMARVSKKISNNSFEIMTSVPNIEVSWQVTAVRNDKAAQKFALPVEMNKSASEKGKYLNPELYNQPAGKAIHAAKGKNSIVYPSKR